MGGEKRRRRATFPGFMLLLGLLVLVSSVSAATRGESTIITGDRLVYYDGKRTAEITGGARIVRGETVLTCQRLKAFLGKEGDLVSAEARGEVRIDFGEEDIRGEAEAVDYFVQEKKVVLSGEPQIWQKESKISGKRITIILKEKEEKVIVEEEVKAIYIFEETEQKN